MSTYELNGVYPDRKAKATPWVAVWRKNSLVVHDPLPLRADEATREEALAFAEANPPRPGGSRGDAWLNERAR
jgi:hypothetical protein